MYKHLLLSVFMILTAATGFGQSSDLFRQLNERGQGDGQITLMQDTRLYQLVDAFADVNKRDGINGYRVQIFSGSGQNARTIMSATSQKFLKNFPNFDPAQIYTEYKAPYFKMCVGDFRSRGEANAFYHKIKELYPDSYVVKSKINYPKLANE